VHHIGIQRHDFRHGGTDTVDAPAPDPAIFGPKIAPDAPDAVALLRPCRNRPSHRAAEPSDEFAPSKANAHLPLHARPVRGSPSRQK
jgi:hypothetical protein